MKKRTKKILLLIALLIAIPLVFVGGYIGYMSAQYYRIEDNTWIETSNPQTLQAEVASDFSITTYNIGFGAYNQDFSFFMDSGIMKDGTSVQGEYARAQSEDIVHTNTDGVIEIAKAEASDFYFFQEVDTNATRSFYIDQYEAVKDSFPEYGSVYTNAFHSGYLLYPFQEPHGSVESGLVSLSRYAIRENIRKQYPIDNRFITKFTDLDRCFTLSRVMLDNGLELVLINSHMSAYDAGGTIRKQQLEVLNKVMNEEYEKGNYVIVGGDFNHDIAHSKQTFKTEQEIPEWIFEISEEDISSDFYRVIAENSTEVASCRSSDMPYTKDVNYTVIVDGFIVSNNVLATAKNIDADFRYSDHNPVQMSFQLIP